MASWTTSVLKWSKKIVSGLLLAVCLWFLYSVGSRMLKSAMKPQAAGTGAPATTEFSPTDLVNYQPKLGSVVELESDRTVDAILSNTFGPAVVMVYAPWCTHCHTMDEAFTKAAGLSHGVPFFKVQGVKCPVSSNKYGVTGTQLSLELPMWGGLPAGL